MSQAWLHGNRRLLIPLALPGLLALMVGFVLVLAGITGRSAFLLAGSVLVVVALLSMGLAWLYLRRPRLSYGDGRLLIHLGWSQTEAVPIDVVECFFMGQAPSMVRGADGSEAETATVVVRFAERAKAWHSREMPAYLGQWCEGYLIIRGTWCEPIDMDLLNRLNGNLAAVHRQQRKAAKSEA